MIVGTVMITRLDMAELTIRQMERTGQAATMTDQQKDLMRQNMKLPVVRAATFVIAVAGTLVLIVLVTAIYFAVFTMVGREGNFTAFLSITAFAFVPSIFRQIAFIISVFVVPTSSLMLDELGSLSPSVFLDRDAMSPLLFTAVSMVDLVTIWILILLTIGYGFVTRKSLSRMTRGALVFGMFLVYAACRLGFVAISSPGR
jgi:hypothetical protein